jgi:hypothetical protein
MPGLKEQLTKELRGGGKISSADVAEFATGESPKGADPAKLSESTTVPLPMEADDRIARVGAESAPTAVINQVMGSPSPVKEPEKEITITPAEKEHFLSAIIGNKRFELPFSLFGGSIKGILRSRTNEESRATVVETRRRYELGEITTMAEYGYRFRNALLRFQLKELNGVVRDPVVGDLLAKMNVVGEKGNEREEVTPPPWSIEAEVMFRGMEDGLVVAIHEEIRKFEAKYWTMVNHATDQNFWQTEGST